MGLLGPVVRFGLEIGEDSNSRVAERGTKWPKRHFGLRVGRIGRVPEILHSIGIVGVLNIGDSMRATQRDANHNQNDVRQRGASNVAWV